MNIDKKIKNISALLSIICLISIVWNIGLHVVLWWIGGFTINDEGLSITPNVEWGDWKWLGFLVSSISTLLFVLALNYLRLFFSEYKLANYFSDVSTKYFHRFSWYLLATSISIPILQAINTLLKSWLLEENEVQASFSFSSYHMNFIVVSLIFLSISWLMFEASKLRHENSSFV